MYLAQLHTASQRAASRFVQDNSKVAEELKRYKNLKIKYFLVFQQLQGSFNKKTRRLTESIPRSTRLDYKNTFPKRYNCSQLYSVHVCSLNYKTEPS